MDFKLAGVGFSLGISSTTFGCSYRQEKIEYYNWLEKLLFISLD
jgi:hypothetical protein